MLSISEFFVFSWTFKKQQNLSTKIKSICKTLIGPAYHLATIQRITTSAATIATAHGANLKSAPTPTSTSTWLPPACTTVRKPLKA